MMPGRRGLALYAAVNGTKFISVTCWHNKGYIVELIMLCKLTVHKMQVFSVNSVNWGIRGQIDKQKRCYVVGTKEKKEGVG